MSADIVNLRRARKAKERRERETTAAGNRAVFGRTKTEKAQESAERRLETAKLDAHRRTRDEG